MNYSKIRKNCMAYRFDLGHNWKEFLNEPKNDCDKKVYEELINQKGNDDLVLYVICYLIEGGNGRAEFLIGKSDSSIRCWIATRANEGNVDNMEFVNRLIEENINDWIYMWYYRYGYNIIDYDC